MGESHFARVKREKRVLGLRFRWLEIHWSDSRERVRELLSRYTTEGDVMLRESHTIGRTYSWQKAHDEFGIQSGVKVYGWDDMRLVRKCRRLRRKARRAHLRGDSGKEDDYDNRTRFYGDKRNASLHKAIELLERRVREDKKLFVVAGSGHIEDNVALKRLLSRYGYVVFNAVSADDVRRRTSFEAFP